jgi:septum formation protein
MIYLASASPRRAELLKQIGLTFSVVSANIDETLLPNELADAYVARLAQQKALAGWHHSGANQHDCVIAADTSVVCGDTVLGKPRDLNDAMQIWRLINNGVHRVLTGVCIKRGDRELISVCSTDVWFRDVSHEEWQHYWQSGEPRDKAGAYGIQGLAAKFITRIDGSYSNVVGLPLHYVDTMLRELGVYS